MYIYTLCQFMKHKAAFYIYIYIYIYMYTRGIVEIETKAYNIQSRLYIDYLY